jgi:hypothetical protein
MTQEPSYLIQGSENPIFAGEVPIDNHLYCSAGCGQMLIENYYPDSFVELIFKCFRCGSMTTTPNIEDGEILAARVTYGSYGGKYLIGGTVTYSPSAMIAGEDVIERVSKICLPSGTLRRRKLDDRFVTEARDRYVDLTTVDYDLQSRIIDRGGQGVRFDYPLVWALKQLSHNMRPGIFPVDNPTRAALSIVNMFNVLCDRWDNSFRFPVVATQFGKKASFFHTAFTLMIADHMSRSGQMVGLSLEDKHGEPNPDLYIRVQADKKFHFEIKTPEAFQITSDAYNHATIKSKLNRVLKDSSRQINRNSQGALFVGATMEDTGAITALERWRDNLITSRGRYHSGLAALVTVVKSDYDPNSLSYRIDGASNGHFGGLSPWHTEDAEALPST